LRGLLVATQVARPIVTERGGTAWWVPFVTALGVALVAALASYYATWRFKKADIKRENAFRVVGLVDDAERIVSRAEEFESKAETKATWRLLLEAQVRAWPIGDAELDDRLQAAIGFNVEVMRSEGELGRARHWLQVAIWNVSAALRPHLSAPRFFPRRRSPERSFPTFDEFVPMTFDGSDQADLDDVVKALDDWQAKRRRMR